MADEALYYIDGPKLLQTKASHLPEGYLLASYQKEAHEHTSARHPEIRSTGLLTQQREQSLTIHIEEEVCL